MITVNRLSKIDKEKLEDYRDKYNQIYDYKNIIDLFIIKDSSIDFDVKKIFKSKRILFYPKDKIIVLPFFPNKTSEEYMIIIKIDDQYNFPIFYLSSKKMLRR